MSVAAGEAEYIVYACPTGPLAEQIERFLAESRARFGPNKAHDYPPHITLTGFFRDNHDALPGYLSALSAARSSALDSRPTDAITIAELQTGAEFLGLIIAAPWLEALTADFAVRAAAQGLPGRLRLKGKAHDPEAIPLHLSLAYRFRHRDAAALATLARSRVDLAAPVAWSLRFYERRGAEWQIHSDDPL